MRDPARLLGRPWRDAVEIEMGDLLQAARLTPAMAGVRVACHLVHGMGGGSEFHQLDLRAAGNFAVAAREAGVERIIYLGGRARLHSGTRRLSCFHPQAAACAHGAVSSPFLS